MKPREKGWLKEYLEFRKDMLKHLTLDPVRKNSHPEHSLYRVIQPTGLMYGQIVGDIKVPGHESFDGKDRMKILLAESLISSSLLFEDKPVTSPEELSRIFLKRSTASPTFTTTFFLNSLHPPKRCSAASVLPSS